VEVTTDIDANGILSVSARDKDTGAEQRITISETSNLDKNDVERMVADAERHRADDAALRQVVDARNELDSLAYQVERRLAETGDALPIHEKARAEMLLADARQAVKEEAGLDRLRSLTAELQGVYQGLVAAPSAGSPSAPGGGGGPAGASPGRSGPTGAAGNGSDDDVIDAEFTPG
jgi:molecular chaperone DnaK